jgi:hypothetical protein
LTARGNKVATQFKNAVLQTIADFCSCLTADEEKKLTQSLGYINKILTRVEEQNA